ncbi:MAG: hypothetical protein IPL73_30925 [Candidatus Obscuribacter sp.]|nr:hypothetical protein [Candidatus Obscuribacter sp.]
MPGNNTQGNQAANAANQANSATTAPQPNTQSGATGTAANAGPTGQPNAANNASGSLNQQGAGGAVATPVQAGHTAPGAQTGTPSGAQQGTGNQTGNAAGTQAGANASQTGNAAGTQAGANASQTGNSAGSQTGNANSGTQNAGTQNQQGAGSATASPVLPGGHSTTNNTTISRSSQQRWHCQSCWQQYQYYGQSNIPVADIKIRKRNNASTPTVLPNQPLVQPAIGNQNQQGAEGSATATQLWQAGRPPVIRPDRLVHPVHPLARRPVPMPDRLVPQQERQVLVSIHPDPTGHAGSVSGNYRYIIPPHGFWLSYHTGQGQIRPDKTFNKVLKDGSVALHPVLL